MRKILIVEDYPPLAKVIAIGAARFGHDVVRVGTVSRALTVEGDFDLVIVDLDLPDGNGVDLVEELKLAGRVGRAVFFTACRDSDLRSRASQVGPVLDKSQGIEALLAVTESELGKDAAAKVVGGEPAPGRSKRQSGMRRRVR